MPARITDIATRRGRRAVDKLTRRLERLVIDYAPVDTIHPNPYNPNKQTDHDFELLCRSIEEDGFTQPVLVQQQTREIVDGEHRWRAARALGMTEIPIVLTDMTPEQMRVSTLRHNRARGNEDVEMTAQVLRDLQALGALDHAKDSLLLDDNEIKLLIDNVPAPELLAGDAFTTAWEPAAASAGHTDDGGQTSLTPDGADALRSRHEALAQARTQQDRQQALDDHRVYRVAMVFSDEEADIVQAILGTDHAAMALLALCRSEIARRSGGAAQPGGPSIRGPQDQSLTVAR